MVDTLTVVSSDKRFPLDVSALMASGQVRLVHTFRTGAECLRALELDCDAMQRIVLIDTLISDISPANLCDALRVSYPDMGLVMVADKRDVESVQRAMLAGARDIIDRGAHAGELTQVVERVHETVSALAPVGGGYRRDGLVSPSGQRAYTGATRSLAASGVVVPVIGARGGAGRSSIASVMSWLAAEGGLDTALVDFDLQFGDLSFIFGATGQESVVGEADLSAFLRCAGEGDTELSTRTFGRSLAANLTLFSVRAVPEKAELMAAQLPPALDALRREFDLIVVNTGAFWTLFHAELLERSDVVLTVLDQTVVGVRATRVLRDLCRRLGVPPSRLLYVMNRARREGLRADEVAEVLAADEVFVLSDEGPEFARELDGGALIQLCERGAGFIAELAAVLDEVAVRSDLSLRSVAQVRSSVRRGAGGSRGLKWGM